MTVHREVMPARHRTRDAIRAALRFANHHPIGKTIGIVAILGFGFYLLVGPRSFEHEPSRADATHARVRQIAQEAYPMWAAAHLDQRCPADIRELREYTSGDAFVDRFGTAIYFECRDDGAPVAISAGEDKLFNTADDVRSDRRSP